RYLHVYLSLPGGLRNVRLLSIERLFQRDDIHRRRVVSVGSLALDSILQRSGTHRTLAAVPALLTLLWVWSPASGEALAADAASFSGSSTVTAAEWFASVASSIRQRWPQLSATQLHGEASARTCFQRLDWLDRDF